MEDLKERVEKVLAKLRPALQLDGGDMELVAVDANEVKVRLTGACHGCPGAAMTLQYGVEKAIKEAVPEIQRVTAA